MVLGMSIARADREQTEGTAAAAATGSWLTVNR